MTAIEQIENAFNIFLYRFLYWGCRVAAFPLLVFYFLYRCARDRRYARRLSERFGGRPSSYQATAANGIWLHAVSVGEVVSAAGLLQELRDREPDLPLWVSVGTVAGRLIAEERLAGLANAIFYAPIDYSFAVRRVLRRIRPATVVILETEIWPVLYREAKSVGASLVIVNGRISDRAFPRYRRWRSFFRHILQLPDAIAVQSEQDRARYVEIGTPEKKVHVIGNLKYDVALLHRDPPGVISDVFQMLRPEITWIAASTMPPAQHDDVDEDEVVLRAFEELSRTHKKLLLILVPRRPERFSSAEQRLQAAGVPYLLRSSNSIDPALALPCVVLLDSIGELASLFPFADIVFMGGTLARRGGHNILEPAVRGRPIIVGPHMENFAGIAAEFREHLAMLEIADAAALEPAIEKLIGDAALREDMGARAAELALKRHGTTTRAVDMILEWRDLSIPWRNPAGPTAPILWLFSKLWIAGTRWKQSRDSAGARHLDTPVISIGGIGMGGAGKTPMVEYLAERMRERRLQPAILTRGYRRKSIEKSIVIRAGSKVPVAVTGDEAQIFVHAGYAHAGIGADRWSTGRLVEEKFAPDVFILDDGFQHRRLQRDLDIVLIDALNPFAGGAVFPLGGLREPLSSLRRADAFVITRAIPGREYRGIRIQLRAVNEAAPIFRSTVAPLYWINERTRAPGHPPQGPVAAFCGLANPASFWQTLKRSGIDPAFTWAFDDHHSYKWKELEGLAAQARAHGANVLLTTEKDAMNLPEHAGDILMGALVDLYWLKIGIQIDDEPGLLRLVESSLK
jgi:3-deoxy-D-manno-octulosonic-acid transferase